LIEARDKALAKKLGMNDCVAKLFVTRLSVRCHVSNHVPIATAFDTKGGCNEGENLVFDHFSALYSRTFHRHSKRTSLSIEAVTMDRTLSGWWNR
jgi:hypothetical protein